MTPSYLDQRRLYILNLVGKCKKLDVLIFRLLFLPQLYKLGLLNLGTYLYIWNGLPSLEAHESPDRKGQFNINPVRRVCTNLEFSFSF